MSATVWDPASCSLRPSKDLVTNGDGDGILVSLLAALGKVVRTKVGLESAMALDQYREVLLLPDFVSVNPENTPGPSVSP